MADAAITTTTATATATSTTADVYEQVSDYYGKILSSTKDLKTSACCSADAIPKPHRVILSKLADEIMEKFYGCGSPLPDEVRGCTVLDLGCGTGRDVYLASALVGNEGHVIGVDMTDEQLAVARKYAVHQAAVFGLEKPNVTFVKGHIEDLKRAGIADDSVDLVISNCVVNLSPFKENVLREIYRVLKPGGELYFSDIYSDRRIPESLRNDAVLYGECLSGALYTEDFRRLMSRVGFADFRLMTSRVVKVEEPELAAKLGPIVFYSRTVRAFKLPSLEDRCEDFGQYATYLGTMEGFPNEWRLDDHHVFVNGVPSPVCGNTADMLSLTRFGKHFRVTPKGAHVGLFDCAPTDASGAGSVCGPGGCSPGACC